MSVACRGAGGEELVPSHRVSRLPAVQSVIVFAMDCASLAAERGVNTGRCDFEASQGTGGLSSRQTRWPSTGQQRLRRDFRGSFNSRKLPVTRAHGEKYCRPLVSLSSTPDRRAAGEIVTTPRLFRMDTGGVRASAETAGPVLAGVR